MQSFMLNEKKNKLGTKITLFGFFLNWNVKKLLSHLKSAASSLSKMIFNHYSEFWHYKVSNFRLCKVSPQSVMSVLKKTVRREVFEKSLSELNHF